MISRSRVTRIAARWTTELVVVFVGVYGAFALSEWEEDRERERRAAQVKAALVEEIEGIQHNTRRVALQGPVRMQQMDSAMRAGATPPLEPMMEAIGFRTHVWEATLASGEHRLLDVATFYRVSDFYNLLNAGFEQLAQLRELSQTMILPALDEDPARFYEPAGQHGAVRLRPQYQWYSAGHWRTVSIARCVTVLGDSLLLQLGAVPDTTAPPLSAQDC